MQLWALQKCTVRAYFPSGVLVQSFGQETGCPWDARELHKERGATRGEQRHRSSGEQRRLRPRKLRRPSADSCHSIAELFSPVGKRRSQAGISFLIFKIAFGRTLFSYFFPCGYDLF